MTGLDLLAKTGSRGLHIAGQWRDSSTGNRFQVHDPADDSVIVDVADGSADDAMAALDAAVAAQAGGSRLLTIRKPVGPCLFITPWNFPLAMGTRKIGPAVAAGCTMVVKPAELTPLTMLALAQVLAEAGLPDGVLNVVTTHSSKV